MKKAITLMATIGAIVTCLFISQVYSQDTGMHADAVRAADNWLTLVDGRKYQETWQSMSPFGLRREAVTPLAQG